MKVKELLTDESKWTRGANARDSMGHSIPSTDPDAKCWCLQGAINFCYRGPLIRYKDEAIERAYKTVQEHYRTPSLFTFNDRQATFEDIKKVIELADI